MRVPHLWTSSCYCSVVAVLLDAPNPILLVHIVADIVVAADVVLVWMVVHMVAAFVLVLPLVVVHIVVAIALVLSRGVAVHILVVVVVLVLARVFDIHEASLVYVAHIWPSANVA